MKKLLSTLLLAAAVPATMLAKPLAGEQLKMNQIKVKPEVNSTFLKADSKINPSILAESGNRTVMFDTIPGHGWWGYYSASNFMQDHGVIQYDEYSDAVYVLHNHFTLKLEADDETRGILRALVYNNGGRVEGPRIELCNLEGKFLWGATFGLSNPTKGTEPTSVNFVAFSPLSRSINAEATQFVNYDPAFCFYNPTKVVDGEPKRAFKTESGPGGSKDYTWDNLYPFSMPTSDGSSMYIAGAAMNAVEGSSASHGKYGIVTLENSNLFDIEYSGNPVEFDINKFQDPTADGHYNTPMFFGKDNSGKLYAFVNNIYRADLTKRLPAIAYSTDNGVSWSELDIMKWEVFDSYVKQYVTDGTPTEDLTFGFDAYDGTDFLMQENGDFSYVAKIYAQDKQTFNMNVYDIVEVYKEGGKWGMRRVEDMRLRREDNSFGFYSIREVFEGMSGDIDGKLAYYDHSRDNELELAITKDRKYLVMKWLDYKHTRDANSGDKIFAEGDTNVVFNFQTYNSTTKAWSTNEIKGYTPTAIYVKYREIGTNTWSNTIQLTNDERYHLHTHMPDMIQSLEAIPILSALTREDIPSTSQSMIATLPKLFREMSTNDLKFTQYHVFNALKEVSSVKDAPVSKDAISVYPNPANNTLTVSCETNSTVEIFNTLGEKMMDVKGNNANVSSLANGIYLVKVTKDGKVSSTLFTVAK